MRKHLSLILKHRAGLRPYTLSFDFAESCVFDKQSLSPFVLPHLIYKQQKMRLYVPKLLSYFAEFL